MTDTTELNVWRDACIAYGGASIEGAELEPRAAAVIRTYGDQRHSEGCTEGHVVGFRAAVIEIVAWLIAEGAPMSMTNEIASRFGPENNA